MTVPGRRPRGRVWTAALVGLGILSLALWPLGMVVTAVLLLPAAAIVYPILDSGRISDRTAWRLFAVYGAVAFAGLLAAAATMFPLVFPAVLLFPFFAALLALFRE